MALGFNEFQKELQKRKIDPQSAYVFTLLYERLIQTNQTVEEMAKLVTQFADSLATMVKMSQADQQTLGAIAKKVGHVGKDPNVTVESVAYDPSEGK